MYPPVISASELWHLPSRLLGARRNREMMRFSKALARSVLGLTRSGILVLSQTVEVVMLDAEMDREE